MKVETYEVLELNSDGKLDNLQEVQAEVEKLGLEGQQKLLKTSSTSIFPYRKMTKQEMLVYRTLLQPPHMN